MVHPGHGVSNPEISVNGVAAGAMLTAMSGLAQDLVEPGLEGKNSHGTLRDRDGDRDRGMRTGLVLYFPPGFHFLCLRIGASPTTCIF